MKVKNIPDLGLHVKIKIKGMTEITGIIYPMFVWGKYIVSEPRFPFWKDGDNKDEMMVSIHHEAIEKYEIIESSLKNKIIDHLKRLLKIGSIAKCEVINE